ncbi:unnamed protein product, partial [Linum tenue]
IQTIYLAAVSPFSHPRRRHSAGQILKNPNKPFAKFSKTVCVNRASGYIASWLVRLLLSRGYTVRASVRDPTAVCLFADDPRKSKHLRALDGASERLQLFKANLLEEGSFDSVIQGCDDVFHTASPFYHDVQDPQVRFLCFLIFLLPPFGDC